MRSCSIVCRKQDVPVSVVTGVVCNRLDIERDLSLDTTCTSKPSYLTQISILDLLLVPFRFVALSRALCLFEIRLHRTHKGLQHDTQTLRPILILNSSTVSMINPRNSSMTLSPACLTFNHLFLACSCLSFASTTTFAWLIVLSPPPGLPADAQCLHITCHG